jgi:poly-gamma-glutamate synthesis protein (capsule biosynthesis protein)
MKLPSFRTTLFVILVLVLLAGIVAIWEVRAVYPIDDLAVYPWLYLRGGQPLGEEEVAVELVAVGDLMLGRSVADEPDPLGAVTPWLRAADIAIGNFEGAIAPQGFKGNAAPQDNPQGPYPLIVPAEGVQTLRAAGFDALGLANNHAFDLGMEGFAGTRSQMDAAGIVALGANRKNDEPVYQTIKGVRLAFLAFNAVPSPSEEDVHWIWSAEQAEAAVQNARQGADVVIVLMHWGYEYDLIPDPAQRRMAETLVLAGADLVLGYHPHVVQGSQVYPQTPQTTAKGDQFIAYSLGNFVFDQFNPDTQRGLALRAFLDQEGLRAVQALPVWAGPRPHLLRAEDSKMLQGRVVPPPRTLRFVCDELLCDQVSAGGVPQSGIFWSGEIDLTGDGFPEQIRRSDGRVTVYENGRQVWQSPPEWQVLDLALGDPNDDGRGEMMLGLRKPDAEGNVLSHPFVLGYRGGQYKVLWGGSALANPIQEVELGDVNQDGMQELIALEEMDPDGKSALSVWRWHGWGFGLVWRSQQGDYQDLSIVQHDHREKLIIQVLQPWNGEG